MRLLTFCSRNLFRRKVRTALCIVGVALAATFVIAVGATTMRYTTVIKEMNVLFSGQIMVVDEDARVIQAIPIGGSRILQNRTEQLLQNITGVDRTVPILLLTFIGTEDTTLFLPVNFSMGIPVENWRLILGPTPLKGNIGQEMLYYVSSRHRVGDGEEIQK